MNKLAIAASAALLLITSAPAQAQSFSLTIGTDNHRYEQRRDYHRYDRRDYERRERHFYSQQRSHYRGRCYRNDLVVRDPYTSRLVCVDQRAHRNFYRTYGRRY